MSLKTEILSPDLQRQIDLLKLYPEIAEKNYRPALEQATALVEGSIRPTIPVLTGRAVRTFGAKVSGKGLNLAGKIGWAGARSDKAAFYINIVEYGARAHTLESGKKHTKKALFYEQEYIRAGAPGVVGSHIHTRQGWRTVRVHPGFAARSILKNGLSGAQGQVDALMAAANEAVAQELAVP